jgi:hypothetical protein
MGQTIQIPLADQSYKSVSKTASAEELINMYYEPLPEGNRFGGLVIGSAGLTVWKNLNQAAAIYGMQLMGGNLYVVCGLDVYKITSAGVSTLIGALPVTPGRVMMTANNTQVTILCNNGEAFYTDGTTLNQITSSGYQLSSSVTTINGYTVFSVLDSNTFFWSALNNTASYSSLDTNNAQGISDNIVRMFTDHGQLWIFKQFSTEIWQNTGSSAVFEIVQGASIQRGCAAAYSVSSDESGIYFLGDDKIFYRIQGYSANSVSDYAVSQALQSYSNVSDAFSFIYTQEGHKFYSVGFPSADINWELDVFIGDWHKRMSVNQDHQLGRWRANCSIFFANLYLIGDYEEGLIYYNDPTNYTENGNVIINQLVTPTVFFDNSRTTVDRFLLKMNVGVGLATGQGSDPQVMLEYSTDGGNTWSYQLWQSIGKIGKYDADVWWTRLGYGRQFTFRLTVSDPVSVVFIAGYINYTQGYA